MISLFSISLLFIKYWKRINNSVRSSSFTLAHARTHSSQTMNAIFIWWCSLLERIESELASERPNEQSRKNKVSENYHQKAINHRSRKMTTKTIIHAKILCCVCVWVKKPQTRTLNTQDEKNGNIWQKWIFYENKKKKHAYTPSSSRAETTISECWLWSIYSVVKCGCFSNQFQFVSMRQNILENVNIKLKWIKWNKAVDKKP